MTQALFKRDANTVGALNQLSADNLEVQVAESGDAQLDKFTRVAEELDDKVDCMWLSRRSTSI